MPFHGVNHYRHISIWPLGRSICITWSAGFCTVVVATVTVCTTGLAAGVSACFSLLSAPPDVALPEADSLGGVPELFELLAEALVVDVLLVDEVLDEALLAEVSLAAGDDDMFAGAATAVAALFV